uniref:Midasin n=1 Tax=Cyprinus carpio carpio TaxID=630221 RepID=A0A9J8BXI4_CYPCA
MENLELSLTSLGAISRHIDKSHNELSKYLAKQIWSQQDRQCILECLAQLLLEKEYTLLISRHLRPLILDLLERNAERIKVDVRLNHDLHERLCVALSKLLNISPDAQAFAARYFSSSPPVFQRLFFTSEEAASIQYGPRRMKLRDLMGATLRFLQSDCEKFRVLWDWSACVSQLLTSDVMVRSYTAQCLALVSHMTDNQKTIFLRKVLSSEEILSLEETQLLEVEKALVLANQGSAVWRKERVNKVTRGQVVTEDLTRSVTVVCGVILPRRTPRLSNLVLVDSTCQNLRRLAMAVASQKPILLEGPIGCGKTALVEYLAAVTGHIKAPDILKVQLGDQTDSKMLLGMYRCTDIPGKFVWQPGSLTQAVSKGSWILLEDIDHAPLDVISVLLPLMENKKLTIPGREDCIQMAPSFQFFATRRTFYSGGAWHRPQSSRAALLDKYWSKLQIGNMSREELKHVLMKRYPNLAVVVERLLDIYCQLTGDRHQISSSPQGPSAAQNISDEHITSLEGRSLSLRDLLKWCERIFLNFDNSCASTAQNVFLEALDCFTAMLSKSESRLKMAEIIGSKLNISREKAQHFCQMYLPAISVTELEVTVGRAMLLRKQSDAVWLSIQTFATTRPSSVLLEQLSVCVTKGEPVLLVGETGTGKTSTVQYLAEMTGHKLRVVNMNQQSDTADLLGGYKPVDQKLILLPLREAFEDLFSQTYSRKQNLTFLGHVQTCFRGKRWQDLLKLMDHVLRLFFSDLFLCVFLIAALLQEQWEALALKLSQTQEQIRACESALVFAFVEGTLAQAVKKGQWILLDEINLAAAETLECLSGLLEGSAGSLVLLDRGDTEPLVRHPDFRLFACMNPATDVGKRNLPLGIRNRFTELYVEELESESDLRILVSDYLKGLNLTRGIIHGIISFYLAVRKEANTRLVDGTGHKPHYSLRTLCRALKYVASDPCYNIQRSLYEGFCLSFLTQLDRSSHPVVQKLVCQYILGGNVKCLKQPIPQPKDRVCMQIEGYWLIRGDMEPTLDSSYILTPSVKLNLKDLARVVSAGIHPVLIQGETSVGKTSLIKWLSAATGNQCVRINNHEHTDIQEYIGCYSSDEHGKLVFKEGVLIDAMRKGYWIILDELNLAPTDVLEALNRLLDDNRELFIAETQEVVKAHPRFMLFATQNPPGLYGGRKVLSRAFRNRFVELHFDELPSVELENILHQRCSLPPSYCSKLIKVMQNLQSLRRGSSVFAGKHGYITLRDLFRWAERYRLEEQNDTSRDWLQHLADDGYMLLAGRVRKPEEALTIQNILEKHFKRTVNSDALFSEAQVTSQFSDIAGVPEEFGHVVWTQGMRRLAVLVGRALRFGESVLLVGDTGCGKTTICQLFAALAGQKFFSVNCHLHMETSDFLGGLRPADAEDGRLFEWHDGPLVLAMKQDGVFLMDEISLADDSVLERLNSVLETEKSLVLAEKGSGDDEDVELIIAGKKFRLVATMNPGGDFGKKELSPALRNRFTEIWCPQSNSRNDLMQIVQHNLRPGLSLDQHDHQGKDIAELMLDFIDWLTNQEFGRRCILSVRDILSWVNFMNTVCERDEDGFMTMGELEEEEPEWDLRLDTVTAFIHAACLVYVDGIGSGTTVSAAENALAARKSSMEYLEQRLSRITELDEEMQDALRVYNTSIPREPQWGEDFFGIDPFYIAAGPESEGRSLSDYALSAGTTAVNAQRILRALKLQRPILLEGSPGVGKTSLVAALAKASGNHLVRINLSEQTDVTDLFGTDLPVEGGKGGEFAWRDGPLLAGLKAGHWIVLDELNLASQSVLEGLNACFDHRAEIYIPELGMRFHVQHEKTKIFGCQNPFTQGGGRKGLPRSFLNRFTQVYVDALTNEDMQFIGDSIFPNIDNVIISKMVQFSNRLVQEVSVERKWGQIGGPWEFNLRDLFRWCQLMQTDQSPGFFNPGQHVGLVYADRMRTEADKAQVAMKVFGEDFEPYMGSRQFHITPLNLQLGYSVLQRSGGAPIALDPPLSITHHSLRPLEALMKCVEMGWMVILVGPTASGKSSLVHLLALLTGHRLRVMAMNSAMDTTELLGGFEQVDIIRPWQQVLESMDYVVAMVTRRGLMSLDGAVQDTEFLLSTWSTFRRWLREEGLDTTEGMVTFEALNKLEVIIVLLHKLNTKLKVLTGKTQTVYLQMDFTLLKERLAQMQDGWTHGGFEWLDGTLVQALQAGDWLLMDNVNFCSPSVLDRLNALLEPGGSLTINERGIIDGTTPTITPHPNFRLFLTMDPTHGEISRAMRNRGVEIYIPGEHEGVCSDTLDLKMVLHTLGVTGDCVCDLLISIHSEIKNTIWDSPASSMSSLLHAASLLSGQLQRGVDLPSALLQACGEAYAFCQLIERQLAVLDSEDWGSGLLCAGVWPDRIPSALLCTEDSCFSSVQRDGQVLLYCLNTLSLYGKRNRPLSLVDLQRAMQSGAVLDGLQFSGGGGLAGGAENALRLLPTAVKILTERASHSDWVLRTSWLSHLTKTYKHAGMLYRNFLNLVSSPDDYRILVDMRWNKQYLDILANTCNFEDEERYMEFMEALNAVANRYNFKYIYQYSMKKLGSYVTNYIIKLGFIGRVDIGHLPHPVLVHLRSFFDLWDSFVLQAVQSGQPYISDHLMFELLQWRDRFWHVCNTLSADTRSVCVMSLHWQWVHKNLILRLGQQELHTISTAIQNALSSPVAVASALKGIQKTLGKPLPFKVRRYIGNKEIQGHMASCGLLDSLSEDNEEEVGDSAAPGREVLLQLARRAQLWPALEELAVLNQMKVTTDLLYLSVTPRYDCELPLVWCELLSETLAALWSGSVTSDPDRWLKWNPLNPEEHMNSRSLLGPSDTGPGMLSRAVWSRCMLGVLSSTDAGGRWDPSGSHFLSSSRLTLGEWRERIGQLQDLSAVIWDNMAMPELADFRLTDCRLQGLVLRRQLQSLSELLSPGLQESYAESCDSLTEGQDHISAAHEIQIALREGLPENLLPEGFLDTLVTCLTQFAHNRAQDSVQLARSGVFWVNMGLLQIQVWAPQTIFDPAVKRAYKLRYAQEELALLQEEWRGRSLSSQLLTGAELEESSTTDNFQHPRIRYLWVRMQQVKEQISELSRKQACRPPDPQYGRLYQELQHYLCSIGQPAAVGDLLSHLLKALQAPKSRLGIQGLLKEEAVWQASQHRFAQRLVEEYPLYPDVVVPLRAAILQVQHGMRLLASQVSSSVTAQPGLSRLVSTMLAFPSPAASSDLACADYLCSRECLHMLNGLGKQLPATEVSRLIPDHAVLLLNALLYIKSHTLSAGHLSAETRKLFRHVCQAIVNEWDEQEKRAREKEQMEASLYRSRSRLHGTGLTEDQQEEREFRRSFPSYHKDFADITSEPSLDQPIIIEDDDDADMESSSSETSSFLLVSSMSTVVQVHQRLCLSYAQSLWYQPNPPTNHSKDHISALVSSYQITAPLIARFYHLMDCEVDPKLMGSQLLLSTLLQNTVSGSGGPAELIVQSDGPYDFYRDPNMSQARICLPALEQLSKAVRQRLSDWPEHPALVQISMVIERILAFSLSSPLAKFLNGLEILLSKAQDWENNASRAVSLRNELEAITQLIIQWRKLELNCWSSSLDNAQKRHAENSTKHWLSIYQLIERYLQEQRTDSRHVTSTLQAFIEGSTLGEFSVRLSMLLGFHCHVLLAPKQEGHDSLCSLLWNLYKYYTQFSESIQAKITQLRSPIEKELKDFVKISKWNDVSFWSIKQSVEKTHRTLFKFVKKFEATLKDPCAPCLVEQGSSSSMDDVDSQPEETSLHRVHRALRAALPGKGRDLQTDGPEELSSDKEPSSLQARLPVLTRKMKKLCVQLVKKTTLPELSEDLDQFTVEIITNVQALQGLTVDRSMEQEKQKAEVKHILIQKQRALADLFKMLAQIGLSYRKGLNWGHTADPDETLCLQPMEMKIALSASLESEPYFDSNNIHRLFAEMMDAWEGCEKYFYRSWARRNAMLTALQSSVKELGLGNIQRCKGFSSHLFKLLLKQRGRLAGLTEHWVQLRKLIDSIQSIKSDTHCSEDDVSGLPPQKPLQHWITRAQSSVLHCSVVLQQLSWILQCCPEGSSAAPAEAREGEVMQGQATLSHPSPMPPHIQPQACLLRRGDSVLNPSLFRFKLYINISLLSPPHRDNFTLCCSSLDRLGIVVGQMPALEQLFIPDGVPVLRTQPALICGLQAVRTEVDTCLTEFTTWKTHLLSIRQSQKRKRRSDPFSAEFSRQLEKTINMVLCAVQTLVKRKEKEKAEDQQSEKSDSEVAEELLKPGHLSRLLEEDLSGDVSSLSLPEINGVVTELLERLGSHRDDCQPHQLQACRGVVRLEPMLCLYSELVRYYLAVLMGAHRTTGKLLSVLANVFTELAQKGFCLPQELMGGGDGEGATEFHDYEGGGIGEGEGVKDVSDKIENEDQVEDTFQEGQDKKEEEQNKQDIKEEDNAIEMSEDFDGKMHDGEDEEDSDKEEDEELDKKMGDLGDGQTDTLDERMWGDEEDDEDDVDSDKEEESGAGMDQGESELVAKDDNTDAGESNKDKNQDKDHLKEEEEKEKIHEQLDEREFDENEVDPYHGKQEKAGETEAMDLPDDLNLDEDGKDEEGGEGDEENPFDIDDKLMEVDENKEEEKDGSEEGGDEMTDEQQEGQIEEQGEENETEEKEGAEKSENQESETDERGQNEEEEKEEEEKNKGQEEGRDENKSIPADQGQKPNEEENEGEDDEAQMESAERKEHASDGLTGEENVQSDTAVELAGAASERDQAKEDGSGAADASQSEGHDSKLMARMSSHKQRQRNTQSFKRKPGQADNERSMGDYNERVNKRLRTVDNREEKTQDQSQPNTQQESDLYEHIKHGEERYDAQTYDAASAEQQKPTGVKQEEEDEEEDIAMDVEDEKDLQAVEAQELKPEKLNDNTASQKGGILTSTNCVQMEKPETQRSSNEEEMKERSDESTIHTIVHQFVFCQAPLKNPEELRREMELQLEAWQRQTLGSQEEESAAAALWHQYQNLTSPLSQQLCEQLRLVLEPTQAKHFYFMNEHLKNFRTGKRLNMRKVIPYIASQFRKDKIWLRRTKPSKRNYQICLAVDDSSSMVDNHSKQLAFESVSVIVNALTLLEVGQVAVCSFGESVQLLHPFHQQFNDQTGAKILRLCQFQQKKTRIAQFLETSTNMFMAAKQQTPGSTNTETSQLLLIVSDGRGLFLEGKERVAAAVQAARSANIFVIFVVLDNPNSRDSILDIKVPIFKGPGELPEIRSYMEEFPFPFYIILRNVNALPETLSDALRQWFELVTATDQ